jgi:hypothetical protein
MSFGINWRLALAATNFPLTSFDNLDSAISISEKSIFGFVFFVVTYCGT